MVGILTDWLSRHYIELSGAILGLVYVFLSVRQSIWTWPAGIATSVLYAYVFYASRFYAGMGLQVYYVVISVYGWVYWLKGKRIDESKELPVRRATARELSWSLLIFFVTFIFLFLFLKYRTDSPVPLMDAVTTSMSIVATWMLARKILENWLIWMVADSASVGLYVYKNLWPTTVLFCVYLALAVLGYYKWKRSMSES
jgi:nicotinamide mononucleotide transporter